MSPTIAKRILKVPFRWLGAGLAVIALAISAMFHGLSAVATPDPVIRAGTPIAAGPWTVTVIDARLLSSLTGLETQKTGDRWFAVVATVDVTANDSLDDMSDIIRLPHVAGLLTVAPQRIILARDSTDVDYLNPGMPERVAFLWEEPSSLPMPAAVDVVVNGETQRQNSLTGSDLDWFDLAARATVRATVLDKRT